MEYPLYLIYNEIKYKRAWKFATPHGYVATYVSSEHRKCVNVILCDDTLHLLDSDESIQESVLTQRCGTCACRDSSGRCALKEKPEWVGTDDLCSTFDSSGEFLWSPLFPAG